MKQQITLYNPYLCNSISYKCTDIAREGLNCFHDSLNKGNYGVSYDMQRNGAVFGKNAQTEVSFKFSVGQDINGNPIYKTYRADSFLKWKKEGVL